MSPKENCAKSYFKNVRGKSIKLTKRHYTESAVKFVINPNLKNSLYYRSYTLFAVGLLNVILNFLHLINITCSLFIIVALLYGAFRILCTVKEESLLVVKPLGYQVKTKYMLGEKFRYIPWQYIEDIFINEVISKQKVLFVLTILGKNEMIPLFLETQPRLNCLEEIYQNIHKLV